MTTVVATPGSRRCTPFLLRVMVFSPEAGFKFDVTVQHICAPAQKWRIVFNLFRKVGSDMVLVVSVEFEAETPVEIRAAERMSDEGVNLQQARQFNRGVFGATKPLADGHQPTPTEEAKVHREMQKALLVGAQ
jgi:hypothetical protein